LIKKKKSVKIDNFFQKHYSFERKAFQNRSYISKRAPKYFLKCTKKSVSNRPLLFLFSSCNGSA